MILEIQRDIAADFQVNLPSGGMMHDDFVSFCIANPELRIERDSFGTIFIMAPLHTDSGERESIIIGQLYIWNNQSGLGHVFSSNAGFTLPNGATRSPDVAWISKERYKTVSKKERQSFARICPDFVIELRSKSDSMEVLQEKMEEYRMNGCRLGFLIDPYEEQAYIYRQNEQHKETVGFEHSLSGEDVLPGFVLELAQFKAI